MAWGTDAGYAINPARDFGPRLASFFTGYGGAFRDQTGYLYFWMPIVAPIIGGLLGAGLYQVADRAVPAVRGTAGAGPRSRPHRSRDIGGKPWLTSSAPVDQGTTSTRFMIFDHGGNEVARHQLEHEQILPQAGWVEHNPIEIWERTVDRRPHRACRRPNLQAERPGRARHHQPARDRGGVGPQHRPAVLQRDRLAGHPHRPDRLRAGPGRPRRRHPAQGRPAAGHLLLRRQDPVDPGERRRGPRGGRARRRDLRQHRQLAAVEPDRRRRRRQPRHRRDQRQPHHADEPGDPGLGRRAARRSSTSRGRCCPEIRPSSDPQHLRRRPLAAARSAARCRSPATSATSRRPRSARSASRPARPRTPTAPATSCCSTPAPSWSARRTAC